MFHLTSAQESALVTRFKERYPDFKNFATPGSLGEYELDYKHAALAKWNKKMGLDGAELLLSKKHPVEVLDALGTTVKGKTNLVSFHSWSSSFGQEPKPKPVAEILGACVRAARDATGSAESLEPIFAALGKHGLTPTWDAISVVLWAFNPEVYFPIKISYYRRLAQELGWDLPQDRPDAEKLHALLEFAKPFWKLCKPWGPRDATDVQSVIWGLVPSKHDHSLGSPFDKFFSDHADADLKLDAMARVIRCLQGGTGKHDPRLVTTYRRSGSRFRINFGNWAVFTIRADEKCQLLLPEGNALLDEGTVTTVFQEPIDGVPYSLGWFDFAVLGDESVWRQIEAALHAVTTRFAHWSHSNYSNLHHPGLYRAIMDREARLEILREGLPDTGTETTGAIWLIAPGEGGEQWPAFQAKQEIAIGWNDTGSLMDLSAREVRTAVKENHPRSGENKVGKMLHDFASTIAVGDRVFAKQGKWAVLGHGIVESGYRYDADGKPFAHSRQVRWLSKERCEMPEEVNLPVQTLSRIDQRPEVMDALNEFYDLAPPVPDLRPDLYTKEDALADLFMPEPQLDAIIELLKRKKNIILQGAPGTGKTFVARRLAYLLMGVADASRAPMVQFHQSTCYEDFIQGYRPDPDGGFSLKDGTFYSFCLEAHQEPDRSFVFIIDEINRGNLSKIFGELMMLIEPDKRGPAYALPLSYATSRDETFHVPENVYLIGTMNTADRSLSMVDYALRRRFAFIEAEPGFSSPAFTDYLLGRDASPRLVTAICQRMEELNGMIEGDTANLGRGYRIGHSFFVPPQDMVPDIGWYGDVIRYEVLPLVEEYWIDDLKRLQAARDLLLQPIGT